MRSVQVKPCLRKAVYAFVLAIAFIGTAHAQTATEEAIRSYSNKILSAPQGAVDPAELDALYNSQELYLSQKLDCSANEINEDSEIRREVGRQAVSRCREELANKRLEFLKSIKIRNVEKFESDNDAEKSVQDTGQDSVVSDGINADKEGSSPTNESVVENNKEEIIENNEREVAASEPSRAPLATETQTQSKGSIGDDLIVFLVLGSFALIGFLAWYFSSTVSCSECGTRKSRSGSRSDVLDKEVRFKTVKRHQRSSDGKIISSYDETVPYNTRLVRYHHSCIKCSNNWEEERWENY
jgi:hypothetical protein